MILLILLGMALIGLLCTLAYTLATFALPFMLGLTAARFAYTTGAGIIGAGFVGFVAGVAAFGVLALLFATLRSPVLRFIIMLVFVVPAAIAGYFLVHGIAREAVPSEVWRQIFCIIGGIVVGVSAWLRLAVPIHLEESPRTS
jgi:hypothetical protein